MAVVDIITSKTFDNGTICASEQTVVIDDEIYDRRLGKFAELGRAHLRRAARRSCWGATVIDPETGFMRPMAVGQKAADIARVVGLRVEPGHQAADRAHSGRGAASIRSRSRSSSRCWRCIARNPPTRRCGSAWT